MKNKVANTAVPAIFIVLTVFISIVVSPYKYEWEVAIRQIDNDKLDVLKVFWLMISLVTAAVATAQKLKDNKFYSAYFVAAIISIARFATLFFYR